MLMMSMVSNNVPGGKKNVTQETRSKSAIKKDNDLKMGDNAAEQCQIIVLKFQLKALTQTVRIMFFPKDLLFEKLQF